LLRERILFFCVSKGCFVLLKNFCGPLLFDHERSCQVLAFMRHIMKPFLSITSFGQLTLFVVTDPIEGNVSGCHLDTCTHLSVRVFLVISSFAANADIIFSATVATINEHKILGTDTVGMSLM